MSKSRCVEVVVVKSDTVLLLWDANGTTHVAADAEQAARAVERICEDSTIPDVAFASPRGGAFQRAATRVIEQVTQRADVDVADAVGIHLVFQHCADPWSMVVWPPKGTPRAATDRTKLGTLLDQLLADDTLPKVPAGAPPDPNDRLLEGAGELVQRWLQG